jgi:hypothetical protein
VSFTSIDVDLERDRVGALALRDSIPRCAVTLTTVPLGVAGSMLKPEVISMV